MPKGRAYHPLMPKVVLEDQGRDTLIKLGGDVEAAAKKHNMGLDTSLTPDRIRRAQGMQALSAGDHVRNYGANHSRAAQARRGRGRGRGRGGEADLRQQYLRAVQGGDWSGKMDALIQRQVDADTFAAMQQDPSWLNRVRNQMQDTYGLANTDVGQMPPKNIGMDVDDNAWTSQLVGWLRGTNEVPEHFK